MAIKGNVGVSSQDILAGDTLVVDVVAPIERIAITAASLFNDTGAAVTVELFESPDATSASGDQIEEIAVPANSSVIVDSLLGQGYASTQNIVAVGSAVGVNFSYTRTEYTDGS